MRNSWEQYERDQELQHLGAIQEKLECALKERNEGRNPNCFSLVSFGWKDADLDPEGCTGIESISVTDADTVSVHVSGHKTFCPDEDWSDHDLDFAAEVVADCGYGCEWTGDEWVASFHQTIEVPWVLNDDELQLGDAGAENFGATADAIIEAARQACRQFSEDVAKTDTSLDNIRAGDGDE